VAEQDGASDAEEVVSAYEVSGAYEAPPLEAAAPARSPSVRWGVVLAVGMVLVVSAAIGTHLVQRGERPAASGSFTMPGPTTAEPHPGPLAFNVTGVERLDALRDDTGWRMPHGEFVVVHLAVTNRSGATVHYMPDGYLDFSEPGSVTTDSASAYWRGSEYLGLPERDIAPGETIPTAIAFDVPKRGLIPRSITVRADRTTDELEIPL
jgi:hypothetical protein